VGIIAVLQLPAAIGAESSPQRTPSLRPHSVVSDRARADWLSAASLDTRLTQTRAGLARLHARTEQLAAERAATRESLRLARRTLAVSQERLAERLRRLYEQGDTDPLAVLVGASSIDEAITGLENLHRIAGQDRQVIDLAHEAQTRLAAASERLAAEEAQARQTEAAAAAAVTALEAAQREAAARAASRDAAQPGETGTRRPASSPPSAARAAGNTLTVTATGYSLTGRTSTGVSVAYGIAAVDPSVIPLGTSFSVPGYGEAVAADTGGAVQGARIDLWFPTRAEALAWGTRTVTITLH
jgi:3D (Asp-Asp-Asp) domain-containing protein